MGGDKLFRAREVTIEERDAEAFSCCISCEIASHSRETEYPEIRELGHDALSLWFCRVRACSLLGRPHGQLKFYQTIKSGSQSLDNGLFLASVHRCHASKRVRRG